MKPRNKAKKSLRVHFLNWLGLTNELLIKVYHGYGHAEQLVIYGHVFRQSPLPQKRYSKSVLNNTWALLRLFMVKPFPCAKLQMAWQGQQLTTEADKDGFFKFEWKDQPPLEQGWHEVIVQMVNKEGVILTQSKGSIYIPY